MGLRPPAVAKSRSEANRHRGVREDTWVCSAHGRIGGNARATGGVLN